MRATMQLKKFLEVKSNHTISIKHELRTNLKCFIQSEHAMFLLKIILHSIHKKQQ